MINVIGCFTRIKAGARIDSRTDGKFYQQDNYFLHKGNFLASNLNENLLYRCNNPMSHIEFCVGRNVALHNLYN